VKDHRLEGAEIFRRYGEKFLSQWGHTLSAEQRKALRDIGVCRTAALGAHLEQCDACGHQRPAYDSCRNRHCPKCQSTSRDRWLAKQAQALLPVPYCHVVFTVPGELAPLARQNQRFFYSLLFRAVAQTLLTIAADRRHLGARIGFLAVLHTWSQNLLPHPHLHCLVPAGGIALDGSRWISCRPKFFLPVEVLSCLFRRKLLAFLAEALAEGKLRFQGSLTPLADPTRFEAWLSQLPPKWVVYAKPPFGGPEQVLKYLARYTHRVAISNGRLVSLADDQVSFRWRDSKDGHRIKVMTLEAVEFIRRFLLHILPLGFVKIRHFGFLANRNRAAALLLCREHLKAGTPTLPVVVAFTEQQQRALDRRCPVCQKGTLRIVAWLSAADLVLYTSTAACRMDSS
jgi:hypothetical protein